MPMHSSDHAACAALLRQGSRSFAAAALLLPRARRRHAVALYGFCRLADDLIDEGEPAGRAEVIAALHVRLDRAYVGRPLDTPVDREFAATVAACAIPRALPDALLEGFCWDAEGRSYADVSALRDYAARVAGSVGAMMALVMGVRDHAALARAAELGVAMQLSNVARDVGEDARAGRLYLPRDWLADAGIDAGAWMAAPVFTPALAVVVERLLAEAESLYAKAEPGIGMLPPCCRPAIRAALRLYRDIGREVRRRGGNSVDQRAVVSRWRKVGLVASSLSGRGEGHANRSALAETEFLLRAVSRGPVVSKVHPVVWVLDLFSRLEQRDQLRNPL